MITDSAFSTEDAHSVLRLLQEDDMMRFPSFPEVFGQLEWKCCNVMDSALGTDGIHLFFHPDNVCQSFLKDSDFLRRAFLHAHIHCLCLHMIQGMMVSPDVWDISCDLSAGLMEELLYGRQELSASLQRVLRTVDTVLLSEAERSLCFHALTRLKSSGWLDASSFPALFPVCPQLLEYGRSCAYDSHTFWFRQLSETAGNVSSPEMQCNGNGAMHHSGLTASQIGELEKLQKRWSRIRPKLPQSSGMGKHGTSGGTVSEKVDLKQQDSMDYRQFLRRFAVPREEALTDMDAFDYIPYYYGLACYGDEIAAYNASRTDSSATTSECLHTATSDCLRAAGSEYTSGQVIFPVAHPLPAKGIPFIEPLEYREVNRLDELAIAIDTSGSCSGRIVRRFLEETWSILRQRENFFARMRLHLIQCDSMIQEHRIFTSIEEWEDYLPDIRILGQGNTDFRPVFEYLEKLIHKKEIRHLRGLLYFTDGDGIFPVRAPAWDTAFVFLNDQTEKHAIPAWAIRLNLHLPDEL